MTDAQRSAYAEAVELHSAAVHRLAMVYLRDPQEAQDCCQDVFIRLMEHKRGFESEAHRKSWLLAVAKNLCRDRLRGAARRYTDPFGGAECLQDPQGGDEELLALVLALPANDREVLYLHYYEGYAVRELCALLRLRESAVKQRLSRARLRLRVLLDEAA